MNITLDITTKTSIHNPLSAKGQWIFHRFGERNIDLELSLNQIKNVIEQINPTHITLESVFGDPLCHSNIEHVLKLIHQNNIHCTIITYGMEKDAVHLVQDYNFSLFIKVCDKVFLGSNIHFIDEQYKNYKNIMIENTLFKHTATPEVKSICEKNNWQYFETDGVMLSGFCTSVIDQHGNWLYDVHSVNERRPNTLVKTSEAWHRLKMFVKPVVGDSILNKPILKMPKEDLMHLLPNTNDCFVTVSGHVFNNREKAVIFSNALCSDWCSTKFDLQQDYEKYILSVLYHIRQIDFESISINNKNINNVIESYL